MPALSQFARFGGPFDQPHFFRGTCLAPPHPSGCFRRDVCLARMEFPWNGEPVPPAAGGELNLLDGYHNMLDLDEKTLQVRTESVIGLVGPRIIAAHPRSCPSFHSA